MNILVSACLIGIKSRYDGGSDYNENVYKLSSKHNLIPVCPEQLGGLPTPRRPAELCCGKVVTKTGKDVTAEFKKGAREVLKLAEMFGCKYAVLKSKSPSCGKGFLYDGSFSGRLTQGNGITADLLIKNGVEVISENDLDTISKLMNLT